MQGIETILKEQKIFIGKTAGDSMEPMLCAGRDTVVIVPPSFPLKIGDVPVYRYLGHYTMHRILLKTRHRYIICGDNRVMPERNVREEDIIGVLTAFYHDGKYISCEDADYRRYTRRVLFRYPFRLFAFLFRKGLGKLKISRKGRNI